MKSIKFLNMLVDALPLLEVMVSMSDSKIIDWFVDLARRLKDDEDLLVELASWLSLLPGFEAKPVPEKVKDLEFSLLALRDVLRA